MSEMRKLRRGILICLKLSDDGHLRVTGLVLAQIDPKGMKRYGYGGKYGAYSRYGKAYYGA